ncbi:MAG: lipoyl(octanoyl) transferase LipB [Planctomycetes bacterium]|nr:lipoyl(octanoyl) transferase LipB [Planctomycetota bacterium]
MQQNASHLEFVDCGLQPHAECLARQQDLVEQRRSGDIPDTVLLVEHPTVITLGARQSANKLLASEKTLQAQGIEVFSIRRGGGTTAHNPGQIVFYPILDLRQLNLAINDYVRTLESIGIDLLATLGVEADRKQGFPGLWIGPRKIASIGVRVTRQITFHGMAINIQNDLSVFGHFVPCGLDGVDMTSAALETGRDHDMSDVKDTLKTLIEKAFTNS